MPALPFTPPMQSPTAWRRYTEFHTKRALRPEGRSARLADALEYRLSLLPGADLWLAAWRGDVSVHWAFWALFVAPLIVASMAARLLEGWGLIVTDLVSIVWMVFSFLLVWRSGGGHAGWGSTPPIYRMVMSLLLLPVALMLFGLVTSIFT